LGQDEDNRDNEIKQHTSDIDRNSNPSDLIEEEEDEPKQETGDEKGDQLHIDNRQRSRRNGPAWWEYARGHEAKTCRIWKYSGVTRAMLLHHLPFKISTKIHIFDATGSRLEEAIVCDPNPSSLNIL
jgi:hypothetical protein